MPIQQNINLKIYIRAHDNCSIVGPGAIKTGDILLFKGISKSNNPDLRMIYLTLMPNGPDVSIIASENIELPFDILDIDRATLVKEWVDSMNMPNANLQSGYIGWLEHRYMLMEKIKSIAISLFSDFVDIMHCSKDGDAHICDIKSDVVAEKMCNFFSLCEAFKAKEE